MRKGLWWEHAVCVDQAEGGQKADEANPVAHTTSPTGRPQAILRPVPKAKAQAVKLKARYDLPVEPRPAGVGPGIEQAVDQADKNIYLRTSPYVLWNALNAALRQRVLSAGRCGQDANMRGGRSQEPLKKVEKDH